MHIIKIGHVKAKNLYPELFGFFFLEVCLFSAFSSSESDKKTFLQKKETESAQMSTRNVYACTKSRMEGSLKNMTYFSWAASSCTMLSGSISLLSSLSWGISITFWMLLSGRDGLGVSFWAHCLRRSFPSRTTLQYTS